MELIGHENAKEQIKIAISSAKALNTSLPHIMFKGSAGCGKTSFAKYVAKTCDANFISATPDDVKDNKTTLDLFERLDHSNYDEMGNRIGKIRMNIIFFDEIHRMKIGGQEPLGIAMENFNLPSSTGKMLWLPYFTIIGATTDDGKLSKPFRDRFKLNFIFHPYEVDELIKIIDVHTKKMKIGITPLAKREIAVRGRGTPRIIVGYIERCRDMALSKESQIITPAIAKETFDGLGIDESGLVKTDLIVLKELFKAGESVGIDHLQILTGETKKTITDTIEPYLIKKGFMFRSGSGRKITKEGAAYLEKHGHVNGRNEKVEIPIGYERK